MDPALSKGLCTSVRPLLHSKKPFRPSQNFVIEGGVSKRALTILGRTASRHKGPVFYQFAGVTSITATAVAQGTSAMWLTFLVHLMFIRSCLMAVLCPQILVSIPIPASEVRVVPNNVLALPLLTNEATEGIHNWRKDTQESM